MKTKNIFTLVLASILLLSLISCSKDSKLGKPKIILTEVGHDNGKVAMRGDDMHLEADITAEALIKSIHVEIHQEGGSFEIEKEYTSGKYIGVKNTEFHEHIDIPSTAPLGEYHLHFTVTDQKGRQATAEAQIRVIEYDPNQHHDD